MFGIGMLMFVICWFPYVWMEKYVWAGCAVGILPVVWFWFVQREAIQEGLKEEVIGNSVLQIQQYFREIQSTVRVQADERTMAAGMLAPVSYTHLDVYKRQALVQGAIRNSVRTEGKTWKIC